MKSSFTGAGFWLIVATASAGLPYVLGFSRIDNSQFKPKAGDDTMSPKDMLALPRASPALASPNGKYAISAVSEWDFKNSSNKKGIFLISLNASKKSSNEGVSHPVLLLESSKTSSFSEPVWISDDEMIYLNSTDGSHELWYKDLGTEIKAVAEQDAALYNELFEFHSAGQDLDLDETSANSISGSSYIRRKDKDSHGHHNAAAHVLTFPTAPGALKYAGTSGKKNGGWDGVVSFSAHVWRGHSIEETEHLDKLDAERPDDLWLWDETFIREWDTWRDARKEHQIFLTGFNSPAHSKAETHAAPKFFAPFNASGASSLMNPFGSGDYDLAVNPHDPTHVNVVMQIKDPHVNYAHHTRRVVYQTSVLAHDLSSEGHATVLTSGDQGAVTSLTISPDGKHVAWLEMREDGNESDRNRLVTLDFKTRERTFWTEHWDRSPSAVTWAHDSGSVYMLAEDKGTVLPYHLTHPGHLPTPLLFSHATSSIKSLKDGGLLIAQSDVTHPPEDYLLVTKQSSMLKPSDGDKEGEAKLEPVTAWSAHGLKDKTLAGGEKFWFKGSDNTDVMGWMIKPKGWEKGQHGKYPLAFLIHGGPESAWEDAWSTRWNPNVFAQQGYFVVMINFAGSTGYGDDFVRRIRANWGGRPYKDLVAGLQHILEKHPEIDTQRTAALGASYGGYMISWLAGHNEHTKFKCMVNHDGLFDTHLMYYVTEETYFSEWDFGGNTPYDNRFAFEEWNPANFVQEWNTPMLLIQGGKDFRVPEYQSVASFSALQRRGIPSRLLYFPSENHWVLNPENSVKWHHEVLRWLDEWVGDSAADQSQSQQPSSQVTFQLE